MTNRKKLFRISLQFFAEGNEGGTATGEGSADAGETASVGEVDSDDLFLAEMEQKYGVKNGAASAQAVEAIRTRGSVADSKKATETAEPSKDGEGAEEGNANAENGKGQAASEKTAAERFDELIRSDEFKGIYGERVAAAIRDRMKNQTDAVASADRYKGALGLLASKYGKSVDDVDGIIAALEADDELLEEEATRSGKSVDQLRGDKARDAEKKRSDAEVLRLRGEIEKRDAELNARRDVDRWMREAQETVKSYPDFDLAAEMNNADFMRYLRLNKMSVTDAYKHAHMDELMERALTDEKKRAEENAAKVVESNRQRFREGAATPGAQSPVTRVDPANMTDAEFERIEELRQRGVRITEDYFM